MAYNISYLTRYREPTPYWRVAVFQDQTRLTVNIEELKKQAETEIADFIAQKIAELNKNTGKEVSEIRFIAREKMTGLESYDVKIKIM